MKKTIFEIQEELEAEKQERLKENGYKEVVRLREGENYVEVDLSSPVEEIQTVYGKKSIFPLIYPEDRILMASEYLTRILVTQLVQQENGQLSILKFNDGAKVKYKVANANGKVFLDEKIKLNKEN